MRSWILPALVLGGAGVAAYVLTRPASSAAPAPVPATGTQEPVLTVPGVGGVQIPGIPWYVRSADDLAALVELEARRVAAGGKLNTRPRATCAGGSCG